MKTIILIFLVILLTSCNKSEVVSLEKYNMFGEWEKTSVIYGFYNNYQGCEEIKSALLKNYPDSQYRCLPNNNPFTSLVLKAL